MKTVLAILALSIVAVAADEPKPAQPPIPEVIRLRLVSSYQKTLMAQQDMQQKMLTACAKDPDCQQAQAKFNADVTELQTAYRQATVDLKLPADEELSIDANAAKTEDQVKVRKVQPAK